MPSEKAAEKRDGRGFDFENNLTTDRINLMLKLV